jgi:hypothetical protein
MPVLWSDGWVFDVTVEEAPSRLRKRLEDPGAAPSRSESCGACLEGAQRAKRASEARGPASAGSGRAMESSRRLVPLRLRADGEPGYE